MGRVDSSRSIVCTVLGAEQSADMAGRCRLGVALRRRNHLDFDPASPANTIMRLRYHQCMLEEMTLSKSGAWQRRCAVAAVEKAMIILCKVLIHHAGWSEYHENACGSVLKPRKEGVGPSTI